MANGSDFLRRLSRWRPPTSESGLALQNCDESVKTRVAALEIAAQRRLVVARERLADRCVFFDQSPRFG
jgi:hypothetical protein